MLRQTKDEDIPERVAEVASAIAEEGLRYVNESAPGYRRKRMGTSFSYYDQDGRRITDRAIIRRIKSIGIPPAYEFVWICPWANGHIQATGLDARGRKQYRYHPKWRELRDQNKYEHIMQFAAALPALRSRVASDMKGDGLPRKKVLGTIVSLSRQDAYSGRQRGVCREEQVLWPHHHPAQTCRDRTRRSTVRVHGQVGQAMETAGRGQAHRWHREALRGNPGA